MLKAIKMFQLRQKKSLVDLFLEKSLAYLPLLKDPAAPPLNIPSCLPLYFVLPKLIGMYLCLYMCKICLFIVMKKSMKKYSNKIGQKTGTSNKEKNVIKILYNVALEQLNQNLNSGIRLANGRYSLASFCVLGSDGPSLSADGSSKGDKKAIKLFNK